MAQPNHITELRSLVTDLYDHSYSQELAVSKIHEIHQIFTTLSGVSGNEMVVKYLAAVPTATGMALSMNHAAQCLLDYKRTVMFIKGFINAIKDVRNAKSGEQVHIFYAGCGPYAPFFTMIAPLFSREEVRFTMLEINEDSLHSAKALCANLGLEAYVEEWIQADATQHQLEDADHYDILFSETLDALLYRESYVPIMWNFRRQLKSDVTIIPANVTIEFSIHQKEERHIQRVFDTQESVAHHIDSNILPDAIGEKSIPIKEYEPFDSWILDTIVHIYKDTKLLRNESSLTLPLLQNHNNEDKRSYRFNYVLSPQVEFRVSRDSA